MLERMANTDSFAATRKLFIGAFGLVLVAGIAGSVFLPPRSFAMTSLTNTAGVILIGVILAGCIYRYRLATGTARNFWALMAIGSAMWVIEQAAWVYYEVVIRQPIPDLFWGDFLLFLHLVPMMAAIAEQPHLTVDVHAGAQRVLDQALLAAWWVFVYLIVDYPWQFIQPNVQRYSVNYTILYMMEYLAILIAFMVLQRRATGAWRTQYRRFAMTVAIYMTASLAVNLAIDFASEGSSFKYYPGSAYDLPWLFALAVWAWAVWERLPVETEQQRRSPQRDTTPRWAGRLSMAAALSVPAVAVYVLAEPTGVEAVDQFRLFASLFALIPIALLVFAKQWLLNRELMISLDQSRRSYDELGRMQEQLLQTEKMVSIGRLVAGAAHEINNPLTAIVGYSDLMANDQQVKPEHRDFANKILEQARQTKGLVQNLLAFAKSDTGRREPIDLNRVTTSAIQLRKLDLQSPRLTIRENLAPGLPPIMADATQLTHVLLQLISQMASLSGVNELRIRTWREEDQVFWSCTPAVPGRENVTPPEAKGVGVSVSHGIIRDHGGALRQNSRAYLVRLPATRQPATV
jgi:hypothetical protein